LLLSPISLNIADISSSDLVKERVLFTDDDTMNIIVQAIYKKINSVKGIQDLLYIY
jgi:hypothetical protein